MSERPSWKKPPKPPANDIVAARVKEIEERGREPKVTNRALQRGGGTPRSVIYSQKMAIPKKRRKK